MTKLDFDLQLFAKGNVTLKREGAIPKTKTHLKDGVDEAVKTVGDNDFIARNNTSADVTIYYDEDAEYMITGFKGGKAHKGQFIEVQKGQDEDRKDNTVIRYYFIGDDGTMFKRVYGKFDDTWTFVPEEGTERYFQTEKAGVTVKDEDFNTDKAASPVYHEISVLDFSKDESVAYYSLSDGYKGNADDSTLVSKENIDKHIAQAEANKTAEKSQQKKVNHGLERSAYKEEGGKEYFKAAPDEIFLEVKTTTENGISTLDIKAGYVDAYGNIVPNPDKKNPKRTVNGVWWKGSVTIDAQNATINYTKPKEGWHIIVNNAAVGSQFDKLSDGDYIDTAATGDEAVELKAGTHIVYNMAEKTVGKKIVPFQEKRTLTVEGESVKVKTNESGEITSLTGISSATDKVTVKSVTVSGQTTTTYEYAEDGVIMTTIPAKGKKSVVRIIRENADSNLMGDNEKAVIVGSVELNENSKFVAVGTGEQAKYIESVDQAEISVTASGNGKYTISDINDGEAFNYGEATYTRYKNSLFTVVGEEHRVYDLGAGKAKNIAGEKLDLAKDTTSKSWKKAVEADDTYVVENISLAQVDALVAKNNKANKETAAEMSFIHDRFVIEGTKKAARNTTLAETYNADFQHQAGKADTTEKKYNAETATAGQNITAASGWTITAGKYNDTIIGAAAVKGKADEVTTYNAGAGHNTIKLGSAKEKVIVGTEGSYDTITGYASGKDEISVGAEGKGEWKYLVKGSDLYITNAQQTLDNVDENQHALLKGAAVSTKAVTINGKEYYFGGVNVNVTRDKKTKQVTSITATDKQSNTFIYTEGAYYMGSTTTTANDYDPAAKVKSGLDTLKVQGEAKPEAQVIDLTTDHYVSIDAVDASKLAAPKKANPADYKGVNVTASSTGLRFTGSQFDDTVNCGDGKDYIIININAKHGKDTINNFDVDDVIQLNGLSKNDVKALKESTDLQTTLANNYGVKIEVVGGKSLSVTNDKITVNNG